MGEREVTRINGDDGLPADEVGEWTTEKHSYLTRYIDISRAVRKKYIGVGKGGAVFFDLFCGTGRSRIRSTGEWIDGSAVAAWKASLAGGAPFSQIFVSDTDRSCVESCAERLRQLQAPVVPIHASAVEAVDQMVTAVSGYGLYLAFLDPYNLGALDFRVIRNLTKLKRIDLVIHLSAMDLQRNLAANIVSDESAFDVFAPGWRQTVNTSAPQRRIRTEVVMYWRQQIAGLGKWPSTDQRLITGDKNQPLYWLLLASSHDLAHKFWSTAVNPEGQKSLF